jgi:GTP-binding protein HflX
MVALDVDNRTGLPGVVRAAHLLPTTAAELDADETAAPYAFLEPKIPSQLDVDFLALINFSKKKWRAIDMRRADVRERTILVGVATGSMADAEESMAELRELATSAGVVVQDEIIQRRTQIDPRTVMGRGKLDELLVRALQLGADLIVFDRELQPAKCAPYPKQPI